jgi:NTE family protein
MHVVRLMAPMIDGEGHSRDIDFTASGIQQRWSAGREDANRILEQSPWLGDFDPLEGFILHESRAGAIASSY